MDVGNGVIYGIKKGEEGEEEEEEGKFFLLPKGKKDTEKGKGKEEKEGVLGKKKDSSPKV